MATKFRIAKLIKDARTPEPPPMPRAAGKHAGLYLLALRSHTAQSQTLVPRRKLVIPIKPECGGEDGTPESVKITHT